MDARNFSQIPISRNLSNYSRPACVTRLRYSSFPADYGYSICGPVMSCFILLGLIGNFVCLFVFLKRKPVSIVYFYTIPLCISDCAVLVGTFAMTNLPHLLYGRVLTYGPYVRILPISYFSSNLAYTVCVWITVLLSIERYFAICHPLRHRFYDAKRRSILISIACSILAILYNIPRYFELDVFECFEWTKKTWMYFMRPGVVRDSKSYWITYKVILSPLLFSFGPLILLCVLNFRIRRVLRKSQQMSHNQQRKSKNNSVPKKPEVQQLLCVESAYRSVLIEDKGDERQKTNRERQKHILTYTMFCVMSKFLICHSLPAIIDLCETFMSAEQFHKTWMEDLVDTSTLLIVVNSSLNIFMYLWCNREFRERVKLALSPGSSQAEVRLATDHVTMR